MMGCMDVSAFTGLSAANAFPAAMPELPLGTDPPTIAFGAAVKVPSPVVAEAAPPLVATWPAPALPDQLALPNAEPDQLSPKLKREVAAPVLLAVAERVAERGVTLPASVKPAVLLAASLPIAPVPSPAPTLAVPMITGVPGPALSALADEPLEADDLVVPLPCGVLEPPITVKAEPVPVMPILRLACSDLPVRTIDTADEAAPKVQAQGLVPSAVKVAGLTLGPVHDPLGQGRDEKPPAPAASAETLPASEQPAPRSSGKPEHAALPTPAQHALPTTASPVAVALHALAPATAPLPPAVPSPGPPAPIALGPDFGVRIGLAIVQRVTSSGKEEITLRLDPAELGKISVRLSFDEHSGHLRAVIATENPAVLEALRRDASDLTRAFAEAGLRTDGQSLRFDGGGDQARRDGSPQQHGGSGGNHARRWAKWAGAVDDALANIDFSQPVRRLASGRIDLLA